jgi:hypothetical protein
MAFNWKSSNAPQAKRGFVLLPRSFVVERSFAWTARFRRLVRDYERLPATLAGLHLIVFACLMRASVDFHMKPLTGLAFSLLEKLRVFSLQRLAIPMRKGRGSLIGALAKVQDHLLG